MSHETQSSENHDNVNQAVDANSEDISQANFSPEAVNDNKESENNDQEKALSPEADSIFSGLSDDAKELFANVYESLYKIPVANKLAAKLAISYQQFWLDRHQEKAQKPYEEVMKEVTRIETLKQHNDNLRQKIAQETDFKKKTELSKKLYNNDKELSKLEKSRNKAQSKVEKRQNKMALYANERNSIALKLIDYYDDKLVPIESEISNIKLYETEAELIVAELEIQNEERQLELGAKQQQLESELSDLRQNFSDKEINKHGYVDELKNEIFVIKKEIIEAKEEVRQILLDITKQRQRAEKRANPYRDKKAAFEAVTKRSFMSYSMPSREYTVANEEVYQTTTHPRNITESADSKDSNSFQSPESAEKSNKRNVGEYSNPNPKVSDLVDSWNKYISDGRRKLNIAPTMLGPESLLAPDSHISLPSFKKWLLKRYNIVRYNSMPDRVQLNEEFVDKFISGLA
jgi:hypothetical protein